MTNNTEKPSVFSALEVANVCGVVNQTAINWIRGGHLKAYKTPGGQYRVYPEDLVDFLKKRNMRVPEELLSKCFSVKNKNNKLLIVDDDKGLNTVIATYIKKKYGELEIFQAFDGFEAGVLMTKETPNSLILDLDLPGVDGFSLCKRINENQYFGNPNVIVITALEDSDVEKKVKELGVKHFFKKPLNLLEITKALDE